MSSTIAFFSIMSQCSTSHIYVCIHIDYCNRLKLWSHDHYLLPLLDIYAGWIAQTLQTNLLAETWQRKAHLLPSNCSLPYHVMNIKTVCLPEMVTFSSYEDHSKWCVSWEYQSQWTCIGDINRESTQAWRGGGLICTQNSAMYKAFRSAVAWYKIC